MNFLTAFLITFVLCWLTVPALLVLFRIINFYTTVAEGHYKVYLLFGRVLGVIREPGLHFTWFLLGPQAALVHFFGKVYEIDASRSKIPPEQPRQHRRRDPDGGWCLVRDAGKGPSRLSV